MTNVFRLDQRQDTLSDAQAEQSLLGMLLARPQLLTSLPPSFSWQHYANEEHADIHRALVEVGKPGAPAAVAVIQALGMSDPSQREYVAKLLSAPASYMPGNAAQFADLITDLHRRRVIVGLSEEMRRGAFEASGIGGADQAIAQTMTGLDALVHNAEARGTVALNDAMDDALAKAEEASKRDGPAGICSGFPALDERTGGFEDGTLHVLAGRPGMGKSALGHQIALNVARSGIGVLEISLEMSSTELGRRTLSLASGVPVTAMKKGDLRQSDFNRLVAARRELADLPLSIEDGGGLTATMIALKARAAHRRHGLGMIMVDHLHIVRPEDADIRQGPTWAIGRISGAMKRLAKDMNIPVLLLAQLNRGVEGRDDKRPGLSDLRHSGDIEQDADSVCFVYRAEYYMRNEPSREERETDEQFSTRLTRYQNALSAARGKAELIFAKVRDGEPGTVPLSFSGETTSFSEPDNE